MYLAEYTGKGVRIAVIDSGVHAEHPHVRGVAGGMAIREDGSILDEYVDRLGHGTAVTAAIREKAPDAEIFAIKVFWRALATDITTLVRAIDEAAEVADAAGSKSFVGPSTAPAGTTRANTSSHAATTARNRCPAPRGVGRTRMTDTRSGLRSGHEHPVQGQPCRKGVGRRYGTGFPPHRP